MKARKPSPPLPYGRQSLSEQDIQAVIDVLRSDWLTTGPTVERFETEFARRTGATHAVAVSNGTAALHAAVAALRLQPGDEIIVPALTFVATANAVAYEQGVPVFADVDPATLCVDPSDVANRVTMRTRAIIAVDYAGQPCDYAALRKVGAEYQIPVLCDACHALGAEWNGQPVGSIGRMNTFSFHPVKPITTGEGGMITTDNDADAAFMRRFRNHGMDKDWRTRHHRGTWQYDIADEGFNYRLSDIQCALGLSQLGRLDEMIARRREIAAQYDRAFQDVPAIRPLTVRPDVRHGYHLYVVRVSAGDRARSRDRLFQALVEQGIRTAVHYPPVHLLTRFRRRCGTGPGMYPVAERAAEEIITLPIHAAMSGDDVQRVITTVQRFAVGRRRSVRTS